MYLVAIAKCYGRNCLSTICWLTCYVSFQESAATKESNSAAVPEKSLYAKQYNERHTVADILDSSGEY